MPVFAPVAASELGVNAAFVGYFVGLVYVGGTFSSLVSGDFIHKYGAIRISQFCLLCCAIGIAITYFKSVPLFFVGALLIGLGYGPVTPASSFILKKKCPVNRMSLVFSLKQTGVPAGHALAGILIPFLVLFVGWSGSSLVVSGMCLALAISIEPVRRAFDDDVDSEWPIRLVSISDSIKIVLSNHSIRRMLIPSFFYAILQLSFITYLVSFLVANFHVSLLVAGSTLTAAQISGSIGRVFWGIVADRFGGSRYILGMIGILMGLVTFLIAAFDPSWPFKWFVVLSVIFGALVVGWNGVYLAELARLAPQGMVGSVTGGGLFFTYMGVVVGPPIFGGLLLLTGTYGVVFLVCGCACALSALPLLLASADSEYEEIA